VKLTLHHSVLEYSSIADSHFDLISVVPIERQKWPVEKWPNLEPPDIAGS
jgi:hypothetical protein